MNLMDYITHPNFISCIKVDDKTLRFTMKSVPSPNPQYGKYTDIEGYRYFSNELYLFDVYLPDELNKVPEDLVPLSTPSDNSVPFNKFKKEDLINGTYLSKYLSLGNQQEDEDGSVNGGLTI